VRRIVTYEFSQSNFDILECTTVHTVLGPDGPLNQFRSTGLNGPGGISGLELRNFANV